MKSKQPVKIILNVSEINILPQKSHKFEQNKNENLIHKIENAQNIQELENLADFVRKNCEFKMQTILWSKILEKYRKMQEESLKNLIDERKNLAFEKVKEIISKNKETIQKSYSLNLIKLNINSPIKMRQNLTSPKSKNAIKISIPTPKLKKEIDLEYTTHDAIISLTQIIKMAAENRVSNKKNSKKK